MKIGTKITLLTSLLILLIVAGISVMLFVSERKVVADEIGHRHSALLRSLVQAAEESLTTKDDILLLNYMKLLRKTEGVGYASLEVGGRVLAHTDTALWGAAAKGGPADGVSRETADPDGRAAVEQALPVAGTEGAVARVGLLKEHIDQQVAAVLRGHQRRIFAIAGAALLLGFVLSLALVQTFLKPIRRLAEATAIIGKGKLNHTIAVDSKDELGSLARDFNSMAAKLAELDQMKRDFVSSVTHELRSPLHSTGLYLGLFQKGGAGELTEKQKSYLKVIEDNTARLARFIDDLLDAAKLERGKLEVSKQEFELAGIFQEMQAMFMPHAANKKIDFAVAVPQALKLFGDPERTRQVLINLLSNAFKFTPEAGRIEVRAEKSDGHAAISVRDTGVGIPSDQLDRVFDKFEQVKGAQTHLPGQQKGTGLGLAIVRGLVEAQGGRVWVESELKKGSVFIFTVPLKN